MISLNACYFFLSLLLIPGALLYNIREPYFQEYANYNTPLAPAVSPGSPVIPYMRNPQPQPCTGFPGSSQWNHCIMTNNLKNQMGPFQDQMQSYGGTKLFGESNQRTFIAASHQDQDNFVGCFSFPSTNYGGSSTSFYSNGYAVRAVGLSLNSNSFNGRLLIETPIGRPDKLEIAREENTIRFELINGGRVTRWVSVTPPRSVSVNSIQYDRSGEVLRIWTDPAGASHHDFMEPEYGGVPYMSSGASSIFGSRNPFSSLFY